MIRTQRPSLLAGAALGLLCLGPTAYAGPTTFSGADPTAGPGQYHPNTDAARSRFDMAASTFGTLTQLDFESSTFGDTDFSTDGVDITSFNNAAGVNNDSFTTTGFNTTPGGFQYLQLGPSDDTQAVTETFTFANGAPITAFGATFTGVGTSSGIAQITFDDGTIQTEALPGDTQGGTLFFGFTDPSSSPIYSVTVGVFPDPAADNTTDDVIGIDDVLLYNGKPSQPTLPAVPESSSGVSFGFGLAALGGLALLARKRRAAAA